MPSPASASNNPVLRLDSVSLGYGDFTVLRDISLEVSRGQVVAMMGGSGSGKTTLLRAATGQLRARAGTVTLFDQDLGHTDARQLQSLRQRMGVLFQQGALFTDLNVFENVAFPLREHAKLNPADMLTRVLNTLEAVGLR
nr:ATP-binding cassette domain-containing protein [Burkholderiaceae bacterium]